MNTRQLVPYLLLSILIHAGALLGIHRFLNWPMAEKEEAEILVPVEIVVVQKTSDGSEPRLTPDSWAPDPVGLKTASRKMTTVESRRLKIEPFDPPLLLSDRQPELTGDRTMLPNPTVATPTRAAAARSVGAASAAEVSLHQPPVGERIAAATPVAQELIGAPRVAVDSSTRLIVIPSPSEGIQITKGATITLFQSTASDISDAAVLPPPGSFEPAVKPFADFQDAEATPESLTIWTPQGVAAAPASTLSTAPALSGLRQAPKAVSDEPRMMVATLRLNSQPSGAQVFVDDLPSGETPLDMQLPVGKHEFRLVLPNHYDWKAQIELTNRNKPYPIFSRLLPIE